MFARLTNNARCLAIGLTIGLGALGSSWAAEAATTSYTSFYGVDLTLHVWEGNNISVLTSSGELDSGVMGRLVAKLDAAWGVYGNLTGNTPYRWPPTTLNGRATIAEVPTTCGAGCGYLGANGIELQTTYWNILYDSLKDSNLYDQVPFYELGRNFWLYQSQLGQVDALVTGFAIANRFVSMERTGAAGAPFNGIPFEQFKRLVNSDLLAAYQGNPALNWQNTIQSGQSVPGGGPYADAPSLAGAMLYQIYQDHGYSAYRDFYLALNTLPAAPTSDQAAYNFLRAAYIGTGQNYAETFKVQNVTSVPLPGTVGGMILALAAFGLVRTRTRFSRRERHSICSP